MKESEKKWIKEKRPFNATMYNCGKI